MKIAKPYKKNWYFLLFVLVILAFGSYVYFYKGKIFRNAHTEGLNNPKNKKGSSTCGPGQVSCTVVNQHIPGTGNICSDTCVTAGTCGPTPFCSSNILY